MKDGGPAFPEIKISDQVQMTDGKILLPVIEGFRSGMSLRDYFAAAALAGILSNRAASLGPIDSSDFAKDAYQVADDMLAEREK
jgi:hypothetical protein